MSFCISELGHVLNEHVNTNFCIKIFPMKFSIFTVEKSLCILHGQVFVMYCWAFQQA